MIILNRSIKIDIIEIEIHHTGHGSAGAGTDGYQQGVGNVAELLAGDVFHLADVFIDIGHDLMVDLTAVFVVLGAGFGGNGEALGNRHTSVGHFGQVGAFSAEDVSHVAVTLAEQIKVFFLVQNLQPPMVAPGGAEPRAMPIFRL